MEAGKQGNGQGSRAGVPAIAGSAGHDRTHFRSIVRVSIACLSASGEDGVVHGGRGQERSEHRGLRRQALGGRAKRGRRRTSEIQRAFTPTAPSGAQQSPAVVALGWRWCWDRSSAPNRPGTTPTNATWPHLAAQRGAAGPCRVHCGLAGTSSCPPGTQLRGHAAFNDGLQVAAQRMGEGRDLTHDEEGAERQRVRPRRGRRRGEPSLRAGGRGDGRGESAGVRARFGPGTRPQASTEGTPRRANLRDCNHKAGAPHQARSRPGLRQSRDLGASAVAVSSDGARRAPAEANARREARFRPAGPAGTRRARGGSSRPRQ